MKKTIFIAEAGVNHNGKVSMAKKLIDIAKRANADFVKFQIFKAEDLVKKKISISFISKKKYWKKYFPI